MAVTRTATQVPISGSVTDESMLSQNTSTKSCSSSPTSRKTEIATVNDLVKKPSSCITWRGEQLWEDEGYIGKKKTFSGGGDEVGMHKIV